VRWISNHSDLYSSSELAYIFNNLRTSHLGAKSSHEYMELALEELALDFEELR
jgi:hypothetical protein